MGVGDPRKVHIFGYVDIQSYDTYNRSGMCISQDNTRIP